MAPIQFGQVGPAQPNSGAQSCTDCTTFQGQTDPASPTYAAPASGTITSWSVQGPTDSCASCFVKLRIFRQTAPGQFSVVAESVTQAIDTGFKTFAVSIPVLAGDMLGIDATNGLRWYPSGHSGDQVTFVVGSPGPGATTTGQCPATGTAPDLCWFTGTAGNLLNVAATLQPPGFSGVATCNDLTVPNAMVKLYSGGTFINSVIADANGAFSFPNTAPAEYELSYLKPNTDGTYSVCGGASATTGAVVSGPNLIDLHNPNWMTAYELQLQSNQNFDALAITPGLFAAIDEHIAVTGRSAWFKFRATAGGTIGVDLTNLAANYDVLLFGDIGALYASLTAPSSAADLARLDAELATNTLAWPTSLDSPNSLD